MATSPSTFLSSFKWRRDPIILNYSIALPIFLEPPVVEIEGGLLKVIVEILNQYLSNQLSTYELGNLIEKVRMDRLIANNSKAIM